MTRSSNWPPRPQRGPLTRLRGMNEQKVCPCRVPRRGVGVGVIGRASWNSRMPTWVALPRSGPCADRRRPGPAEPPSHAGGQACTFHQDAPRIVEGGGWRQPACSGPNSSDASGGWVTVSGDPAERNPQLPSRRTSTATRPVMTDPAAGRLNTRSSLSPSNGETGAPLVIERHRQARGRVPFTAFRSRYRGTFD